MSDRKKDVTKMTTNELARHVFPKKVVDELKRIAHAQPKKPKPQKKK